MPVLSRGVATPRARPRMPCQVASEVTMYTGANGSSGAAVVVGGPRLPPAGARAVRTPWRDGSMTDAGAWAGAAATCVRTGVDGVSARSSASPASTKNPHVGQPGNNGLMVHPPGWRPVASGRPRYHFAGRATRAEEGL